ncbi:hypothetical protein PSAB6_460033 [Paraburkholderia sabiae]|nr:hypothetical protein PSAB6_460033 [Paraburkholderia sabiae]
MPASPPFTQHSVEAMWVRMSDVATPSRRSFFLSGAGIHAELLSVAKLLAEFGPQRGGPYVDTL